MPRIAISAFDAMMRASRSTRAFRARADEVIPRGAFAATHADDHDNRSRYRQIGVDATGEVNGLVNGVPCTCGMVYDNTNVIRTSVGVGLIWQSPFGPLRFDYAVPITKGKNDIVQQFMFGGGTSF
jgi:hypothetical protein